MESALASYCDQAQAFFAMLTVDDRNSFYILSSDESGTWTDTALRRSQLSQLSFDPSSSYYLTHNGFSEKRRRLQSTRQINALFYDLDCHGASDFDCRRLVSQAQQRIRNAVEHGALPQPSMIVDSGRGLHLYYVLQRSIPCFQSQGGSLVPNEKSIAFFTDVQARLASVLDEVLTGLDGLTVDRAVFDRTRVARIPGTYNRKAGRYAQLAGGSYRCWQLNQLAAFRPCTAATPSTPTRSANAQVINFNRLMMTRLKKVAELQEYRGFACEGNRELMAFVYYNTAVQIYDRSSAKERLRSFNARFNTPLPQRELDGIFNAVDSVVNVKGQKGHYILKADTLVRLLALTDKEIADLQFFASKRLTERVEAKRQTKEKRESRNQRVCELYARGTMTQQEVAAAVGCSVRTVYTILKSKGLAGRTTSQTAVETGKALAAASPLPQNGKETLANKTLHSYAPATHKTQTARAFPATAATSQSAILWQPCLRAVSRPAPSDPPFCSAALFAPVPVKTSSLVRLGLLQFCEPLPRASLGPPLSPPVQLRFAL